MSKPSLKDVQQAMIKLIANPETFEAFDRKELTDRRLVHDLDTEGVSMYSRDVWARRLVFCNGQLPLTRKMLGKHWQPLLKEYSKTHLGTSRNPVHDMAGFNAFLSERHDIMEDIPFIADLADYEYTRNVVWSNIEEIESTSVRNSDSEPARTREGLMVLNPTLVVKTYNHPIGRLAQLIHSTRKRRFSYEQVLTYLVFYLEPKSRDFKVHEIGSLAGALLMQAQSGINCVDSLTDWALQQTTEANGESMRQNVRQLIQQLHNAGIIVEFRLPGSAGARG